MITITKQNDGVLFTFENSDKYLYGSGSILVPFNTLSIVADESDMITLKKAASNDVFISARYDTDLGYRSKDDAIDDLKDMLFAETGGGGSESGITSGEVQTMIDESISGKADTSVVNQAISEATQAILSVSGDVQTKVATSDFNAYSAATATAIGNKQDALEYYEENTEDGWAEMRVATDDGDGNTTDQHISIGGGLEIGNYQEYNDGQGNTGYTSTNIQFNNPEINMYAEGEENGETEATYFNITPTSVTINDENVATEPYVDAATSGKADTSAVTAVNNALTAHTANTTVHVSQVEKDAWNAKVDTSAITTAITSGSTNAEIPTAKATYDAIQAGGGGGATYSAGTNISIDTANTINCTLPITAGTGNYSILNNRNNYQQSTVTGADSIAWGTRNEIKSDRSFALGATITINTGSSGSIGVGFQNTLSNSYSSAFGEGLKTYNRGELASGRYNNSVTGSTDAGKTLFSVGNGSSGNDRHNAFEIRQNGDIYVNDGTNDVRLQDTILALGGLKFVSLSQSEYDALPTKDSSTIYFITNVVS